MADPVAPQGVEETNQTLKHARKLLASYLAQNWPSETIPEQPADMEALAHHMLMGARKRSKSKRFDHSILKKPNADILTYATLTPTFAASMLKRLPKDYAAFQKADAPATESETAPAKALVDVNATINGGGSANATDAPPIVPGQGGGPGAGGEAMELREPELISDVPPEPPVIADPVDADQSETTQQTDTNQNTDRGPALRQPLQAFDWTHVKSVFRPYEGDIENVVGNGEAPREEVSNAKIGKTLSIHDYNAMRLIMVRRGGYERDPAFLKALQRLAQENGIDVTDLLTQDEPVSIKETLTELLQATGREVPKDLNLNEKMHPEQAKAILYAHSSALLTDPVPGFPIPIIGVRLEKKTFMDLHWNLNPKAVMEQGHSAQLAYGSTVVFKDKAGTEYRDNGMGVRTHLAYGEVYSIHNAVNNATAYMSGRLKMRAPGAPLQEMEYVIDTDKNGIFDGRGIDSEHARLRDLLILGALHEGDRLGVAPKLSVRNKLAKVRRFAQDVDDATRTPVGRLSLHDMSKSALDEARAHGYNVERLIALHNARIDNKNALGPGVYGEENIERAPAPVPAAGPKLVDLSAQPAGALLQKLTGKNIEAHLATATDTQACLMVMDDIVRERFPDAGDRNKVLIECVKNPQLCTTYLPQINAEIGAKQDIINLKKGLGAEHEAVPGLLDVMEVQFAHDLAAQGRPAEDMQTFKMVKEATLMAQTAARIEEMARRPNAPTPYDAIKTSTLDTENVSNATRTFNTLKEIQARDGTLSAEARKMASEFAAETSAVAAEKLDLAGKREGGDFIMAAMKATSVESLLNIRTGENAPVQSRSPLAPPPRVNAQGANGQSPAGHQRPPAASRGAPAPTRHLH